MRSRFISPHLCKRFIFCCYGNIQFPRLAERESLNRKTTKKVNNYNDLLLMLKIENSIFVRL